MEFDANYTVPKMIKNTAESYPEVYAQYKRLPNNEFEPITYSDMFQIALDLCQAVLYRDFYDCPHTRLKRAS